MMMLLLEVKQTLLGHCFGQMNTSGFRKFQRRCGFRYTLSFRDTVLVWRNYRTWSAGWVMDKAGLWNGRYGQVCGQDKGVNQ